jgi:YebC/PmpR family DNA-binding regulatory protein
MGRIFQTRKATIMARNDKNAKAFTRIGKDDPANNPRLRQIIANAKGLNMPKTNVEAAIKRASDKDTSNYDEVVYEGYGPYGVAILVETATDNPTRTVANLRVYFSRGGGVLGNSGSLAFIFTRKGVFRIAKENVANPEELELELIDAGLESMEVEGDEVILYCAFADFGSLAKALEERNIIVKKAELERVPNSFAPDITEEQVDEILELVEKIEADDDVQAVYHNLK